MSVGVGTTSAALVEFNQTSCEDVSGTTIAAVSSTQYLDSGFSYSTTTAPTPYNSTYRFTRWSNSSYPSEVYRDAWGRSLNPISFVLLEPTTAAAHYLPASRDTDADGLPDWYEIEYFNTLDHGPTYDSDGDSIPLSQEYSAGSHPLYGNSSSEGGVSWADSGLIVANIAGYASYVLRSVPAGTVNQSEVVRPGTSVTSPSLSSNSSFGYWTLDGVRQQDAWGVAYPQITFVVQDVNREGIAYLFSGDGDGDGIPDAYEQYYLGTLAYGANSDTDGDGITLLAERAGGTLPHIGNSSSEGGVSWADSALVTVNLAGYSRYYLTSVPAGTVNQSAVVPDGTTVTTSNMTQSTFGYWELDGVRQQDAWGVALRQFSFVVDGVDRSAVAYLFSGDSDGDGVNDGYEQFYYGSLDNNASSDTDGDGKTLAQEYAAGSLPHIGAASSEGGVCWADSALIVVNLQPFERLRYALIDSLLTEIYSFDPNVVTGWDLGDQSSVALGDWDGDGDLDAFMVHATGLRVYENIGTARTADFSERSDRFTPLANLLKDIPTPRLSMGDWDGDGREDLAIGGETGSVLLVKSPGHFSAGQPGSATYTLDTGSTRALPALGDLTGDGYPDLIVIIADGSALGYEHTGNNTAPYDAVIADYLGQPVTQASGIGIANVNMSGRLDVVAADTEGRLWEFHNQGDGTFFLKSKVWAGAHQGFASGLAISPRDYDGDGDTDVIAGMANGGLIGLRDPRVRRPTGVKATAGAVSILVTWDPDPQSRIKGYHIYRSDTENGTYARMDATLLTEPRFEDTTAQVGTGYWYYVTGVTEAYYPGNSRPVSVESAPSDKVSVTAETGRGHVTLRVKPGKGAPGKTVKIKLVLDESEGIRGAGLSLGITYPANDLTPLSQVEAGQSTVLASGLSEDLALADDSLQAAGSFTITGSGGETQPGSGTFLTLNFVIGGNVAPGSALGVVVSSATLRDIQGNLLDVTIVPGGMVEVDGAYCDGDLTGDGVVDSHDEDLLKELMKPKSRAPTADELKAGDLNGDGQLDQKDWLLLKRILSGLPMEGN